MKKFFCYLIILLILCISFGCGKRLYVEQEPKNFNFPKHGNVSKVLILPFSSFSVTSPNVWLSTNSLIYEAVSENFAMHKMLSVPFEDVFNLLKTNGFLNFSKSKISHDLKEEYNNMEWSSSMRKEIGRIIAQEKITKNSNNQLNPILFLTEKNIFKLNGLFNADFIVRGSITEFRIKKEDTLNPFKIGFINSPLKLISRALYGVGESSSWATGQQVFTGVIAGAVLGSFANEPFNPPGHTTKSVPLLGTTVRESKGGPTDYDIGNAAFWGAMGGFTSFVAAHGGKIPEIVVGLRVHFYNAKTKKLLWSNMVKVHVTPESQWSKQDADDLIKFAIKESVDKIFKSFWENNLIQVANN